MSRSPLVTLLLQSDVSVLASPRDRFPCQPQADAADEKNEDMHSTSRRFRRPLRATLIALTATLSVGATTALAAPAQALQFNVNGAQFSLNSDPGSLASSANEIINSLQAANSAANSIVGYGAEISLEDAQGATTPIGATTPADENGNITFIVYDPRTLGDEPFGTEFTGQEAALEALDKPADVGETADGRTVIFPTKGNFTSGYGQRGNALHNGIDVANAIGTPIKAVMDGTVVNAGPAQGYGNWVVIEHDNGEKSVYGHMATYFVGVGQRVSAGETIALMGNEGRSTGPHLHFEIWQDGVTPVNPVTWFAEQGISVHAARQ